MFFAGDDETRPIHSHDYERAKQLGSLRRITFSGDDLL